MFSAKSLAIMFGDKDGVNTSASTTIYKTEEFTAEGTSMPSKYTNGTAYDISTGDSVETLVSGTKYFVTYAVKPTFAKEIEISANTFPGTYYVTGDTYARSYTTGKDEYFQFIIPKAKVQSENTITLEAEGDPSVNVLLNAEVKAA